MLNTQLKPIFCADVGFNRFQNYESFFKDEWLLLLLFWMTLLDLIGEMSQKNIGVQCRYLGTLNNNVLK
jgi:hypothetical protein